MIIKQYFENRTTCIIIKQFYHAIQIILTIIYQWSGINIEHDDWILLFT